VALLLAMAGPATAAGGDPKAPVLGDELAATVLRWIDAGWLPSPEESALSFLIEVPASRHADLGLLVVEGSVAGDGLLVRSVRPGGWAQHAGIEAGDRIVAVGGQSLGGASGSASGVGARLREALLATTPGSPLEVVVSRGGKERRLAAQSPVRLLPGMRLEVGATDISPVPADGAGSASDGSTCARFSTFPSPPMQGGLFEAAILSVDGGVAGPSDATSVRVAPGMRVVRLTERIPARLLPAGLGRQRDRDNSMEIAVWVEPGRTYLLGARLTGSTRNRPGYWEPVVWRAVAETCR
jgi:membrane-associated protease RseP (regulator of RpoE activity)